MIKVFLGAFLSSAVGSLAKRVLISLGFSLVSFTGVAVLLQNLIDSARNQYSALPELPLAILGLSGFGDGLGMICGALVFRLALNNLPKLQVVPK